MKAYSEEEIEAIDAQGKEATRKKYAVPTRRAIELIKPKERERDACRYDVETTLASIDYFNSKRLVDSNFKTKRAKKAAERLASALRRVDTALKDKNLDFFLMRHFPFSRDQVLDWISRCEFAWKFPSGKKGIQLKAEKKQIAVSEAHSLMKQYGAHIKTAKGSDFCRLAALLFGELEADLHNQCRAALREKRGQQ
jgi:hypothetical protein